MPSMNNAIVLYQKPMVPDWLIKERSRKKRRVIARTAQNMFEMMFDLMKENKLRFKENENRIKALEHQVKTKAVEIKALQTEAKEFKAVVQGRDLFKFFGHRRKQIEKSRSGIPKLHFLAPKILTPYHDTAIAILMQAANRQVHKCNLDHLYNRVIMPDTQESFKADLATELPAHKKEIQQFSETDLLSLVFGLPADRVKCAVGTGCFRPLTDYID